MEGDTDELSISLSERWIWITIPLILVLLPFSIPLQKTEIAGAGPDVISTIWAMWWFQQEWSGAAWGGESQLFNFPFGGAGAILSPISAVLWSLLDFCFGAARATTYTDIILLWLTMGSIMLVGRRLGLSLLACSAMSILLVLPRYPIFTLGETGVVGVAVLPVLWGLYCLVSIDKGKNPRYYGVGIAIFMAMQGVENPYLVFVLPLFVLIGLVFSSHRKKMILPFCGGLFLMALVGILLRGSSGSYESIRPSGATRLGSLHFWVVEREWARASLESLWQARRVIWPSGSMDSIHIHGREFLGWSGFSLGVLGMITQPRRVLPWVILGLLGLLLTTGSDWGGFPSLFGLMNSVAMNVVRALTQPTRYFLLYSIGFGISAGFALQWILKRNIWIAILLWGVMIGEALFFGGLSLRMPSTALPESSCLNEMEWDGAVLVWPWDGADDLWLESTLQSRIFQMVHSQPGATIGTGSWFLVGTKFPGHRLRELGWRKAMEGKGQLQVSQLSNWGYRYVIVDKTTGRLLERRARDEVLGEENRLKSCDTIDIYQLPQPSL